MSLCGCYPACSCQLQINPESAALIQLEGNGDPASGGWTLTAMDTVLAAKSVDGSVTITPAGLYGHEPDLSVHTTDTDTIAVDRDIPNGLKPRVKLSNSGNVVFSTSPAGISASVSVPSGDDGTTVVATSGTATRVTVPTTAVSADTADSWTQSIKNDNAFPILVSINGTANVQASTLAPGAVNIDVSGRLEITSAHAFVGGGTARSVSFNEMFDAAVAGEGLSFAGYMAGSVVVAAGQTLVVKSFCHVINNTNVSGAAPSLGYMLNNPAVTVSKIRSSPLAYTATA